MTEHDALIARNKYRGEAATANHAVTATEELLGNLGATFTDVSLLVAGAYMTERHVNDETTLQTTVKMSAERLGAKCAVYTIDGEWELARYRDMRFYRFPTKEAAEMAGIIRG